MVAAALALALASVVAKETPPKIPAWFRRERFGMFIHWGPVSLKGVEIGWSREDKVSAEEYDALATRFNPTGFNADEWMRIAKDAGMRYIVPTAKHHDGFLLWPSKTDAYNIANTPFRRDVMGELAAAAKKRGLTMCTYFSILDWRSPDYPITRMGTLRPTANMPRHMATMERQMSELIDRYGAKLVWFDGNWDAAYTREDSIAFNRFLRKKSPTLVINDRIDSKSLLPGDPRGDYGSPEQVVGSYDTERPWETCMTLGDQWAYKPDDRYKTSAQVIEVLLRTVTGDGNLLLNVGPDPTGRIPQEQQAILRDVGVWTQAYGESIYGTRGGPYRNGPWGGTTRNGKTIFVHLLNWDGHDIVLPALPAKIRAIRALQPGIVVGAGTNAENLVLSLKSGTPSGPTTIRIDLDRDAWSLGTIDRVLTQRADRSLDLTANTARIHGTSARLQADPKGDNIGYWVDATNTISWPIRSVGGKVRVELDYSCDPVSAGSTFAVEVGGKKLKGQIASTGGWYDYRTLDLGEIQLPKGKTELTVRPLTMPHGAVMNLRTVRLRP